MALIVLSDWQCRASYVFQARRCEHTFGALMYRQQIVLRLAD